MKKRTASLVSVILLVACLLSIPAQAAVPPTVAPCFVDIHSFYANLVIDDNGLATSYAYVTTATSSYTVYLTVYLQKQSSGSWSNVTSGSTSDTRAASKTVTRYVTHGYYYRTKAVATVYTSSGSYVETATTYSGSQYY